VVALLAVLGILAGYAGWWFASGRYGRIPNVAGQSQAAATTTLKDAGYDVSKSVDFAYSDSVPKNDVVRTDPSIGNRVPKGRTVTLTLSKGPELFSLPTVAGMSVAAARAKLAAVPVQLAANTSGRASDTVPKGTVVGTDPSAGTQVKRGQTVTILVSTGPPIVGIPQIAPGTSLADAQQQLQQAGFKTTVKQDYNDTVDKGDVISISPTGQAAKFSTITIDVSKGPQFVTIPKIKRGTPIADAEKTLTDAGLQYQVQSVGIGQGDAVLAISPDSGTQVRAGSTVIIYAF
jgi:serine/threonine-protein kinase